MRCWDKCTGKSRVKVYSARIQARSHSRLVISRTAQEWLYGYSSSSAVPRSLRFSSLNNLEDRCKAARVLRCAKHSFLFACAPGGGSAHRHVVHIYAEPPRPPLFGHAASQSVQSALGVTSSFPLRYVRTARFARFRYVSGFFSKKKEKKRKEVV